jgi:hypothetical protein
MILVHAQFPDVPLSIEQIEELTVQGSDGTETTVLTKGKVFRDSAGRVRADFTGPGQPGELCTC